MSVVSQIPEYPWVAHKDKSTEAQGLKGMFEKKINEKNVYYLLVPQHALADRGQHSKCCRY